MHFVFMRRSFEWKREALMATAAHRKSTNSRQKWSASVTHGSDALTLEKKAFTKSPRALAQSLKRSAERSHRRKAGPYHSAMSMLTFYINRAGKNLSASQRGKLQSAKIELRKLFHK
jgi:hypothetical protein